MSQDAVTWHISDRASTFNLMTTPQWYEDEAFWEVFYSWMFSEEHFDTANEQIEDLLALLDCAGDIGAQHWLDLACGPGRFLIPLADRGIKLTGVDQSRLLLDEARQKMASLSVGKSTELLQADMRTFKADGCFDVILNMWSSFGYFDEPEDDRMVLQRCYDNLKPGGCLLIDTVGKEYLCRNLQAVHLEEDAEGNLLIQRPTFGEEMTRLENEWILIKGDHVYRKLWSHNVYSGAELRALLVQAGFESVELYGSLSGDDYDLDAERLIAVANKLA